MIRMLIASIMLLTLLALPALAQIKPGRPIAPVTRNFAPRYSPDGKWIAYLRGDESNAELWVMDSEGKNARAQVTKDTVAKGMPQYVYSVSNFTWSPDSKSLICRIGNLSFRHASVYRGIYPYYTRILQAQIDGKTRWITKEIKDPNDIDGRDCIDNPRDFSISPDGKSVIVFYGYEAAIKKAPDGFYSPIRGEGYRIYSIESAITERIVEPELIWTFNLLCQDASWGADGRVYCSMESWVRETDTYPINIYAIEKDGIITQITDTKGINEICPALSPDGKMLAYLQRGVRNLHFLVLREMEGEKAEKVALENATAYHWLPDGRVVASACEFSVARADVQWGAFHSIAPPAPAYQRLLSERKSIRLLSPDGGTLMALLKEETLSLAPIQENPFPINIPQTAITKYSIADPLSLPDISPDGKRLVYEKDGTLYLTDMPAKPAEAK